MSLFIGVYTQYSNGTLLYNFSSKAQGLTFTTNEHGFGDCSFFVPMSLSNAFAMYDRPGLPYVLIGDGANAAWEGRLEDVSIVNGGVNLKAFGYWRALSDYEYSAFFSLKNIEQFNPQLETFALRSPQMYALNNGANDSGTNRLFIGLVKGNTYTNAADYGGYYWEIPSRSNNQIAYVSFDYKYNLPANWTFRVNSWLTGFTSAQVSNVTTTGGTNAAWPNLNSTTWTLATAKDMLGFEVFNSTGANYTMAGETGAYKVHIENVRVTYAVPPIYASTIAGTIATYTAALNSTQLNGSAALLESPATDLDNQILDSPTPADTLVSLSQLGDSATPPNYYEVGVWEGQTLHFRQRGKYGRQWYVDAVALETERTIDTLYNRVVAVYPSDSGRDTKTVGANDLDSQARYGVIRHHTLRVDTTSATQAGVYRDASLQDSKDPMPRVAVSFDRLYDAAGGRYPLWACRSGDTITIRNLPPTLSTAVDRIRTFRVSETNYAADTNTLTVTPELPPSRVDVMLARKDNGL